jgi:hypothetical protein
MESDLGAPAFERSAKGQGKMSGIFDLKPPNFSA